MSVCKYCGKQIEYGDCCSECASAQNAGAAAAAVPVQPAERKKTINGKIIALLSALGVFGVLTLIVGLLFN